MDKLGLLLDLCYINHRTPVFHPESYERIVAIHSLFTHTHFVETCHHITPKIASEQELGLCHPQRYVHLVERECRQCKELDIEDGSIFLSTGDVPICPDSIHIARLAVGGVLNAADCIMSGKCVRAFCAVRPPGHHACSERGMGFCLFNNIAVVARYLQKEYGIGNILIVDWDVHHGNGTQDIFEEDPSVFYFSTHQSGIFPGTGVSDERGRRKGIGYTLNCPISAGSRSRYDVIAAFQKQLVPAMQTFMPEFVLISAGFDAHEKDPLGGFNLREEDFIELTRIVSDIAKKTAKSRILSILEGGYNFDALARSSLAHAKALIETQ